MMRDFSLAGAGSGSAYSGTGKGIYQPGASGANESFGLHFDNLWITNFGSSAIELLEPFTTDFNRIHVNYCGGHGIIAGGNTIMAMNCYIHNLPETGAVGYDFFAGSATLINCNGVDDCDVWGRFGRATADGDAENSYCSARLIGCNVEDFGTIGVEVRNGILVSIGTGYLGKAATANLQALRIRSIDGLGFLDAAPSFVLKGGGATWKNSLPVHSLSGSAPFCLVGAGYNANSLSFYDEANSLTATIPTESLEYMAYATYGRRTSNLHVDGLVALSGLANYANDAAAATGGVAVGYCYRNGSVVMVRVS